MDFPGYLACLIKVLNSLSLSESLRVHPRLRRLLRSWRVAHYLNLPIHVFSLSTETLATRCIYNMATCRQIKEACNAIYMYIWTYVSHRSI
jgi:hypothetical protein